MTHTRTHEEAVAVFWRNVDKSGGVDACWPWIGRVNDGGYGVAWFAGADRLAHRVAAYISGTLSALASSCAHNRRDRVLHECDNPPCCNPAHLYVGSQFDNIRDRVRRGREADRRGSKNPCARLTNEQVRELRAQYACGGIRQTDLAHRYGVSQRTISLITRGETWRRV